MKVLLIGNGAREHAIAEKLAQDSELYAIMSKKNPAIAQLSKEYWICNIEDADAISNIIKGKRFDLGFSSPDATLAAGVSDRLEKAGMLVASPSKEAAKIEWDKSFMRELMEKHKIRASPSYEVVETVEDAQRVIKDIGEVAVKPLGLTGGKGVRISGEHFDNVEQQLDYAKSLIEKDGKVLIEEKLIGEEFTLQGFSDGFRIAPMPPVQDHKRAYEGDKGPNTGGMGSYSTGDRLPFMQEKDVEDAKGILQEVIHAMRKDAMPFKGVLYGQFILTADGIKVIEFNARFGDPEAMNVLALLDDSLTNVFLSMAEEELRPPRFSDECTVVKYLVPDGYPNKPAKDVPVALDANGLEGCGAKVYYASVYEQKGKIFTTSSRAFGILGKAPTLEEAEKIAEEGCKYISGPVWHRSDIGTADIIRAKMARIKSLRGGL